MQVQLITEDPAGSTSDCGAVAAKQGDGQMTVQKDQNFFQNF